MFPSLFLSQNTEEKYYIQWWIVQQRATRIPLHSLTRELACSGSSDIFIFTNRDKISSPFSCASPLSTWTSYLLPRNRNMEKISMNAKNPMEIQSIFQVKSGAKIHDFLHSIL